MGINELLGQFETMMSSSYATDGYIFGRVKKDATERHKVLLVLTGQETDMKAAHYVLHVTRRIRAGITILYIAQEDTENPLLKEYLMKLQSKGIELLVIPSGKTIQETIIKFIEEEEKNDINFVVMDSQDLGISSLTDQKVDVKNLERLRCPLVLVSETARV
jgi:nucleotide-binding universal stress UspA family protein